MNSTKQNIKLHKIYMKAIKVDKKVNAKYRDWSYPAPSGPTAKWTFTDWSKWIEKHGKKAKK